MKTERFSSIFSRSMTSFGGIVLGVGENLCTKEGDDMIRDYWDGLVAEVSVVDTQLGVKPVDFVRDEFSRDETLG
jgi:hypothetical protein